MTKTDSPITARRDKAPRAELLKIGPKPLDLFAAKSSVASIMRAIREHNLGRQACAGIAKQKGRASVTSAANLARGYRKYSYVAECKAELKAEQLQDELGVGVRDRQRLDTELLLNLQSRNLRRGLVHIGVDERTDRSRQ